MNKKTEHRKILGKKMGKKEALRQKKKGEKMKQKTIKYIESRTGKQRSIRGTLVNQGNRGKTKGIKERKNRKKEQDKNSVPGRMKRVEQKKRGKHKNKIEKEREPWRKRRNI